MPSQSPYTFQVVILQKKTGEIHLCVDYYQKLNSIMVRDAFPLPRIDETLQAVHSRITAMVTKTIPGKLPYIFKCNVTPENQR